MNHLTYSIKKDTNKYNKDRFKEKMEKRIVKRTNCKHEFNK